MSCRGHSRLSSQAAVVMYSPFPPSFVANHSELSVTVHYEVRAVDDRSAWRLMPPAYGRGEASCVSRIWRNPPRHTGQGGRSETPMLMGLGQGANPEELRILNQALETIDGAFLLAKRPGEAGTARDPPSPHKKSPPMTVPVMPVL